MEKRLKSLILSLFILLPLNSWSTIIQYETTNDLGDGKIARTEIMVSEVSEDELDWKIEEFKKMLQAPENKEASTKYVYSAPTSKYLTQRKWEAPISSEEITSRLTDISFSDSAQVEIPDEFFERSGRVPQSEDSKIDMAKEFEAYYAKNFRKKRITLIASRTLVNGTVATIGFIAGGMPMAPAMVVGPLTGLLSGSLQVFSKHMNEYLESNKYEIKLRKLLGLKPVEQKASKFIMSQVKWFSLEVAFLSILDLTRFSLGVLPETGFAQETMNIATTTFKSLASQGLVDTSVAKEFSPKIRAAVEAGDFARAAKLRFRTELIGFSASMTWAGAAITDMMGLPVGNYLFTGMGTVGAGNHIRLVLADKLDTIGKSIKSFFQCSWLFKKLNS